MCSSGVFLIPVKNTNGVLEAVPRASGTHEAPKKRKGSKKEGKVR